MNSKKTNFINAIWNALLILSIVLFCILGEIIESTVFWGNGIITTFFSNRIVNMLLDSNNTILILFTIVFIFSFISAFQNRKDKKLLFWKIVLGLSSIITMIQIILYRNIEYEIADWLRRIFFCIIPIIFAIINLVLIKKNRPKIIQLISYVGIILLSVSILIIDIMYWIDFEEYVGIGWCIIAVIMQLIYTLIQEDNRESNSRRTINILLYVVLQGIIAIGLFIFIVFCICVCKIHIARVKNEIEKVENVIVEQSTNNKEEFIIVEKNSKDGWINEKGEEVIKAEYDAVSPWGTYNIENRECEFCFAKKNNDFYIILKNKKIIDLKDINNKYFKESFELCKISINNGKRKYEEKELNRISLSLAQDLYLMIDERIKPIIKDYNHSEKNKLIPDYNDYDNDYNYVYTYNLKSGVHLTVTENEYDSDEEEYKYNIETRKNNQLVQKDKNLFIPFDSDGVIKLYSNGSIPFCNIEKNIQGWYDTTTGQSMTIEGNYQILDIVDNNYIIIRDYNTTDKNEMIVDGKTGNIVIQGKHIDKTESGFIITDKNQRTYLTDEKGNTISQQFDYIKDISDTKNELFVCVNNSSNGAICNLMDSNGEILTKQSYSNIDDINLKYYLNTENRTVEHYFDDIYEAYYSNVKDYLTIRR